MNKATASHVILTSGLNFFLDITDDCFVIPRGEAYEFFNPGKSSKSTKHPLHQLRPHRKLKHPGSYRGVPEAFITLHNLVDYFFQMTKSKRELGRKLLYQLLFNLLSAAVDDGSTSSNVHCLSELKNLWLKEVILGVCRSTVGEFGFLGKLDNRTLVERSKTEIHNIFGPNFVYDSNLIGSTIDKVLTFKKRIPSLLTTELKVLNNQITSFKTQQFGKNRFPNKSFGLATLNSTVINQTSIKISKKVTETFSEYFRRINKLPSPNMVTKISLLWKQKNVKEKLSKYDSLKERYDNLCLHTDFVVRNFRVGLSPQSPIDHIFSQVLFYDQARLKIFDSRDYEFNRQSALDIF